MRRELCQRSLRLLAAAAASFAMLPVGAAGLDGLPLDEALRMLEADGLRIFYSTDLVKPWMRVEAEPGPGEPLAVLAAILAPHGLTAETAENGVVLVVRNGAAARLAVPSAPVVAPTGGVAAAEEPQPVRPRLEEIIVSASRYPFLRAGGSIPTTLTAADIEYQPGLGDDALRPAQRLPGAASNGFSARAHVRGGEIGETLVLFDGLRLYDPFHLKDFQSVFSVVDPRVVSSMDVYTGAFPAAYGDRLSSVIDVDSMNVSEPRRHEIGLSLFNASLLSAGQLAEGRGQWLVSARRSNLDLLYQAFSDLPERPRYVDAFAKLSFEVSPTLTVTGSLLGAVDDLELADDIDREERAHADHHDTYRWITLDHRLPEGGAGRTLVSHARFDSTRTGVTDKEGVSSGVLTDRREFSISSVQSDWSLPIGDLWLVELGAQLSWVEGRYDYSDAVVFDVLFDVEGAPTATMRRRTIGIDASARPANAHIAFRRRITDRLTGDFGLRWDHAPLYSSDSSLFGPRIGLRFDLTPTTEIRASAGRINQTQAINELQVSDGIDEFMPPQRSDHLVVGVLHELAGGGLLRAEVYRKRMPDPNPRFENLLNARVLLPELRPDRLRIDPEAAAARGFEISYQSARDGPFDWWLSYAWSEAEDRYATGSVPRSWDQPHSLGGGADWTVGRWQVGVVGAYRTGWPTTAVALGSAGDMPTIVAGPRNDQRLGDYLSIDLLISRSFEFEQSTLSLSFELTNMLDRANDCCIEYEIGAEDEPDEAGQLLLKNLAYLPLVPSVGVRWSF